MPWCGGCQAWGEDRPCRSSYQYPTTKVFSGERLTVSIADLLHQPLLFNLHHCDANADVDVERGLGPGFVDCPSLKCDFGSLEFIVSQPTRSTIVMVCHGRPHLFFSVIALSWFDVSCWVS